jgi:cobyrinic acid a,c-diamide synthase
LRRTRFCPWEAELPEGAIAAHEFHYSRLENLAPAPVFAFEVLRGSGVDGRHDGIVYKQTLANYTHLRDVAGSRWTRAFLAQVRRVVTGGEASAGG